MIIRTTLPWPPSAASPNGSQGNYRAKAQAGADYKLTCWALLKEAGSAVHRLPAGATVRRVTLTYCPPPRVSRYDFDNMGRRMKHGLDALAEALGVDDGAWQSMLQQRGERCKGGAVLVEIEAAP